MDEELKDDGLEGEIDDELDTDEPGDEEHPKKKKGLLDDENVESLDDAAEDELADEEEPYDDVDEM